MARPLRVLGVGSLYPPHHLGGYEVIWQAATRALRARGHQVRALATADRLGGGDAAEDPDVHRELHWYWSDHDFPHLTARRRLGLERHNHTVLAAHLAAFRPDVVCWWAMGGMSLALLEQVRRAGIPAVGVVGDSWMDYGFDRDGWQAAWRRRPPALGRIAERLTAIPVGVEPGPQAQWLFISDAIRRTSIDLRGWDLPRTGLAHPGIDPARFPPSDAGPWGWRLAYVGRIDARKGIATAIEALAHLPEAAVLTIDGGGDAEHADALRALAGGLGLAGRVRFTRSAREDLASVYAAADAVLFPVTWDEPWGLVPLEAMSVGRPVVATGTGGSGEYLRDGANCLLFAPGDVPGLASAVRRLADAPDLRAALVAEGRRTAATYTEEAFHDVLEDALLRAAAAER